MDNILKELFGDGDEPKAASVAAPATPDQSVVDRDRQAELDAQREARREARKQRKADPERHRNRKEFVDRYTTGSPSEGFTAEEALGHIREMRDELSPAEFRKAMEQTLNNLPADQRDEFIALMRQYRGAQAATGASATGASATAADPFGGLLTGLLGGGSGSAGGVGVGDVLDDLRRGSLNAPASAGGGQPTAADFEALINSPLGKAVLGGLAAYGMQTAQADDNEPTPHRTRG